MLYGWEVTAGLTESNGSLTAGFVASVTCRLTAEDRDQRWMLVSSMTTVTVTLTYTMHEKTIRNGLHNKLQLQWVARVQLFRISPYPGIPTMMRIIAISFSYLRLRPGSYPY